MPIVTEFTFEFGPSRTLRLLFGSTPGLVVERLPLTPQLAPGIKPQGPVMQYLTDARARVHGISCGQTAGSGAPAVLCGHVLALSSLIQT
jgi:hypothetical protein